MMHVCVLIYTSGVHTIEKLSVLYRISVIFLLKRLFPRPIITTGMMHKLA